MTKMASTFSDAATVGLLLGTAGPAAADYLGDTDVAYNNACYAASGLTKVTQVEPFSINANHTVVNPSPGNNVFEIQTGEQHTPSGAWNHDFLRLEHISVTYTVDLDTFVGATVLSNGYNFTGSPRVDLVGNKLTLSGGASGLTVGPNIDYQLPGIEVTTTNPILDLRTDTAGLAGQFGNYSNNYYKFVSWVKPLFLPAFGVNTSCIPADGPVVSADFGTYPTLNGGVNAPSHP